MCGQRRHEFLSVILYWGSCLFFSFLINTIFVLILLKFYTVHPIILTSQSFHVCPHLVSSLDGEEQSSSCLAACVGEMKCPGP